jgi:hypothetical protein
MYVNGLSLFIYDNRAYINGLALLLYVVESTNLSGFGLSESSEESILTGTGSLIGNETSVSDALSSIFAIGNIDGFGLGESVGYGSIQGTGIFELITTNGFLDNTSFDKMSVDIYNYIVSDLGNGEVNKEYPETADYRIDKALMYEGSQAERMVSEKLKTEVYAILLLNYFSTYKTIINEKDKILIDDKELAVIAIENVGHQNHVLQIAVKEF